MRPIKLSKETFLIIDMIASISLTYIFYDLVIGVDIVIV